MKRGAEGNGPQLVKKASRRKELTSGRTYLTEVEILPEQFNEEAFSLREILQEIQPIASLHFNFMVDLEWLLEQYPPACRSSPITLVVGEKQGTDAKEVKRDAQALGASSVSVLAARLPIPFGTHHSKLSIFESDAHFHVIVSTANLVPGDWEAKTQGFYYARGEIKENETSSQFQEDLIGYLKRYDLELDYWIMRLRFGDFGHVQDQLVCSVPGYHKGEEMEKIGHPLLKSRLKVLEEFEDEEEEETPLYVAQCSSIGSLGSQPTSWLHSEFFSSLSGGNTKNARMFLIYPCVEDVKGSIEGYEAGCSLPYQSTTNEKQPWLRSMMCKWRSETNGRSKAMPHVKTYTKLINGQPKWMLLTSANLSKAAWGERQKNGTQLCIRSYEIGILITDKERVKLPYDYPILRYSKTDEPWLVDKSYHEKDSRGERWITNKS